MDFFKFRTKETRNGVTELFPSFTVGRSTDLMVRGGQFYAIWNAVKGLWSTDEYDVALLVDEALYAHAATQEQHGNKYVVKDMQNFETGSWSTFQRFVSQVQDNSVQLDQKLTFANTDVKKSDYVSKRLPYALQPGPIEAWDELVGTLYSATEREKIEWIIGAIVSGDSVKIQKFGVLYGPPGSGKGTILDVIERLFAGYTTSFDAKQLGSSQAQFATEVFKNNPLVAIQGDGDLSKIEDNARLNQIISHEPMNMNEKFKSTYTAKVHAFLLMGTNKPVKISDAKSGIIRRLIDIHPTGVHIPVNRYNTLMSQIDFELGAIAHHCLQVYLDLGRNYYNGYRPLEMMLQTDIFFNFIEANYDIFSRQNGATLTQAYMLYKEYCSDTGIEHQLAKYKFREELRNYFDEFKDRAVVDGHEVRSYYAGFNATKFKAPAKDAPTFSLVIEETESILDYIWANMPAQLATQIDTPKQKWSDVTTVLGELDTRDVHFVKVPDNHIIIDFDLKGEDGEKSLERNLEAASNWPATYAELSKSGKGVHLHYIWDGDTSELAPVYSEGIEVKVYTGDSSLRRRLSKCNGLSVATISSGLPLKDKKSVSSPQQMKSEKGIRDLIARTMQKEFHSGTKSAVDFIKKILDDAHKSGMEYDVSDLKPSVIAFASTSSNQALVAMKMVGEMKFSSTEKDDNAVQQPLTIFHKPVDDRLVFYDVEVYPNLFVICWKFQGAPRDEIVVMINPTPQECEELLKFKLVGFNCRRYDNHILHARILGYSNENLYRLSQKIIDNNHQALFGQAYGHSYTDIYDFSSVKKGLKKFMIELGLRHMEMDIPWDKPVPDDLIPKVVEYCCNDVEGTEATFEARKQDFLARQILAALSGLTVNDTTQKHTARIIFGADRYPQAKFEYTHLKDEFPGYEYSYGKSTYRGENPSEGGYVYAEPGMYENVAVLDVASMHPTSIEQLNLFGPYTSRFAELKEARVAIKRGNYDAARNMMDGKLSPFLEDTSGAKGLSDALKIAINIVYGLTSAKFDNPFRDIRNKDNIVAKRGALFMIDLKHAVQEQGYQVVHIKTDSIKIPNATPEIIEFITQFGAKYGYDFEHEATYDKFCLVNDAVYIAREGGKWEAVGAQFQHPYVYKTLFTKEELTIDDLCETKQVVKGSMYLDFDHETPREDDSVDRMRFVGRTGRFTPVTRGGMLYCLRDGKLSYVQGTKGHLWAESDQVSQGYEIDMSYFNKISDKAIATITKFGDFDSFVG